DGGSCEGQLEEEIEAAPVAASAPVSLAQALRMELVEDDDDSDEDEVIDMRPGQTAAAKKLGLSLQGGAPSWSAQRSSQAARLATASAAASAEAPLQRASNQGGSSLASFLPVGTPAIQKLRLSQSPAVASAQAQASASSSRSILARAEVADDSSDEDLISVGATSSGSRARASALGAAPTALGAAAAKSLISKGMLQSRGMDSDEDELRMLKASRLCSSSRPSRMSTPGQQYRAMSVASGTPHEVVSSRFPGIDSDDDELLMLKSSRLSTSSRPSTPRQAPRSSSLASATSAHPFGARGVSSSSTSSAREQQPFPSRVGTWLTAGIDSDEELPRSPPERQAPVQRPRSAPCSSAVPRPSLLSSTQPGRRDLWGEVATGVTQHLVNQAARPQSPGQVTFEGGV
ncbi:unnamed protein product, partial [Polarella glacialis]